MARVLTADHREVLEQIPGWAQDAPEHQALAIVFANESARMRTKAQEVRDGMIPVRANALTLPLWELMLKLQVNPPGLGVAERRGLVIGKLLAAPPDPSGTTWQQRVTSIIGPTWTYEEEAEQTIKVSVPWGTGTQEFQLARRVLRATIPAAWELNLVSEGGFILDESELDEQQLDP